MGKVGKEREFKLDSTAGCMQWHSQQEKLDVIKNLICYPSKKPSFDKGEVLKCNNRTAGYYDKVLEVLSPEPNTSSEHLVSELKETTYDSYWKYPVGLPRDQTPILPRELNPYTTTFGKTLPHIDMKEVLNPTKTPCEKLLDIDDYHDQYVKSHGAYYPGEQMRRAYESPFSLNTTFGHRSNVDPHGKFVRCNLRGQSGPQFSITDRIEADVTERHKNFIGRSKKISCPVGHNCTPIESCPRESECGVRDLLCECDIPSIQDDLRKWLSHLNRVRLIIKRKEPSMEHFYGRLKYYDRNKSGWIDKKIVYEVCEEFEFTFNRCIFEPFLEYLHILKDDKVNIRKFTDILDVHKEFPDLKEFQKLDEKCLHFVSTFRNDYKPHQVIARGYEKKLESTEQPQYTSTPSVDSKFGCRAFYELLCAETTVKSSLNPSLQTKYGLTHRDYCLERSKEELSNIFKTLVPTMTKWEFEKLYQLGIVAGDGKVTVQILRDLM